MTEREIENIVLIKLGLTKRGALFILANKPLCKKIVDSDVIELKAAEEKYNISKYFLKKAVLNGALSTIANGPITQGKKTFLFEDEIDYLKNMPVTFSPSSYYINKGLMDNLNAFYLAILSDREYNIIISIIKGHTVKDIATHNDMSGGGCLVAFHRALSKIKTYHLKLKKYNELSELNRKLEAENSYYKFLNKLAWKKCKIKSAPVQTVSPLGKLSDHELSIRLLNCLAIVDIYTIGELLIYIEAKGIKNLLKIRAVGAKTYQELEEFLKKINYKVKT